MKAKNIENNWTDYIKIGAHNKIIFIPEEEKFFEPYLFSREATLSL